MDKEQVQAQLRAKSEAITSRLGSIQGEVATAGEVVRAAVYSNPLVGIGGAVAAGLLVGLLFGGSRKRKGVKGKGGQLALIGHYIEAIAEETQRATRKGADTADAVRDALRDRVPVIFYAPGEKQPAKGAMGEAFELVYKTALGFAVKYAVDFATARLNLDGLAEAVRANEGSDAAAPVAAIMSE